MNLVAFLILKFRARLSWLLFKRAESCWGARGADKERRERDSGPCLSPAAGGCRSLELFEGEEGEEEERRPRGGQGTDRLLSDRVCMATAE